MKNIENKTEKYDFQFTIVPSKLMTALDPNCCKMLFTLIGLSSRLAKADGWFFRSNAQLIIDTNLSKKLVTATIDTLYRHGIVDVKCIGQGKGKAATKANEYKINFDKFKEFDELSFDEFANPENQIQTVNYKERGYSPMYLKLFKIMIK